MHSLMFALYLCRNERELRGGTGKKRRIIIKKNEKEIVRKGEIQLYALRFSSA